MMEAIVKVAAFAMQHADLLQTVYEAVTSGVDTDKLKKLIRESMVAASDAEMQRELG